MNQLWPRLCGGTARIEFDSIRIADPSELKSRATHPQQTFAATGGARVHPSTVDELINQMERVAISCGYPHPAKPDDRISFDRAAAESLFDATKMTAFEASQPGVWNFLALVAMPRLTWWRFGTENPERWIASDLTRHMFARLWWHALIFGSRSGGATDYTLLRTLSESDLNQLTERKSLGGNHRVARTIAREIQSIDHGRRDVLRRLASQMRRLTPFIDFSTLNDEQLTRLVSGLVHASLRLEKSHSTSGPGDTASTDTG
ncbi:DUF6339 family protein [Mycobacteroides salmoniphilum]|uniref:DUF6339 family protein n=1 Tax=Mycobacteroides salmoniphilum TaxID=404941 RepID=UPI0009945590|nr:DUF6339 family protein [Mycobacteroides salmoniphilum]